MKHARAWVEGRHPGSFVSRRTVEAGKLIKWIPLKDGTRLPRSKREDLFGCIDLAVFPKRGGVELIQVTSITKDGSLSAVNTRKAKVRTWLEGAYGRTRPDWLSVVWLIGWVPGKHFRIWQWQWVATEKHFGRWIELPPERAPIPKRVGSPASRSPSQALSAPLPF